MDTVLDELVNFFRSKVADIIGVGVVAALGGWVVAFGNWHPLLRFAVLFVVLLFAVEVARALQRRKDVKGAELIQRLIDKGSSTSITFSDEFQSARVVWAMWYSGNIARSDRVLDGSKAKGKVLLLHPTDDNYALVRATGDAGSELNETQVDINYIARHALKGGFETGFFKEYYGYSMTIYDTDPTYNKRGDLEPDSNSAWVTVKQLDPQIPASERTLKRVFKSKDPTQFQAYFDVFKQEWGKRVKAELKDDKVTTENHQWEVKLECKSKAE